MFSHKLKSSSSNLPQKSSGLRRLLLFGALIAAIFAVSLNQASAQTHLNNIFWYISPSDPYIQDWSDTASISNDDTWDNFIAVTGHTGANMTAAEGVNAQTVLADGINTPIDVIANQSNPNALTVGGVAEFDGIANPTVALKGSSDADAPHLLIRINTKSCPDTKFMTVGYKVRDLDSTANNAIQQVALHYRIGDTGNYSNVPAAFVADATEPNAATKVTTVFAMLPLAVLQQDALYVRILTTNAGGTDEWTGIDDISIGCFVPTAAQTTLSGTVSDLNGSGVAGAIVTIMDPLGNLTSTRTNNFGNYRFKNISIGSIYILQANHKAYRYTPQIQIISAEATGINFIPESEADLRETESAPPPKRK